MFEEIDDPVFESLSDKSIPKILKDQDGQMWIGTENHGLYIYSDHVFTLFRHSSKKEDGLKSNYIHSIFRERNGAIFIGNAGISTHHKSWNKFRHYSENVIENLGIKGVNILSFAENEDGTIWFETENDVLHLVDFKWTQLLKGNRNHPLIKSSYIRALEIDASNLWIGTMGNGLIRMSLNALEIEQVNALFKGHEFENEPRITSLQSVVNSLFVGTVGNGIFEYNQELTQFQSGLSFIMI